MKKPGTGRAFFIARELLLAEQLAEATGPVRVVRGADVRTGFAEAVDDDFALVVRWEDGSRETVTGGDVSVRGLFGYLD